MRTIVKRALIPTTITGVFLLILCQFITDFNEFTTTIIVLGAPLWLFSTLFSIFAYKDLKETISKLHNDNTDNSEQ